MNMQELFDLMINQGIDADPRGRAEVEAYLAKRRQQQEQLTEEEKKELDPEMLTNPYADSRILCGDPAKEIKRVLVGVDIEVGEVLLADRLCEKGTSIDLIIAHHPEGKSLAALHDVMHLQEDMLAKLGVPINVAEGLLASRISEVKRGLAPLNHNRAVDAAKLLGFAMMCVHTPADNQVQNFLENRIAESRPETAGDILKLLKTIPEYQEAAKNDAGPTLFVGRKEARCGKVMVDMTGGTSGSEDAYAKLAQAGIGTIIGMHMNEKHRKEAEKHFINVVIAGHMASDSLGINLLLDSLEERGIDVVPCAGLIRVRRNG
ncbi:NGG1p interacting factor NIF3 [Heliophilum fasciatum]|uniref:Putative NIF3 family GTP cyclohydrolase 1 type 2 n=1 Tax=Heliophilum fasciatum TaxID=35700 RepID=A0A4R2RWL4_9FIRM|nr:NGG1p interacting factor NIF3 [Heliophilum fasciatum]MCW2276767.1 putative NIF3 family GTP cyclohydrolase 1 type 2 [Heliophilum fasciatum]TCP68852.1 putative NIF3 family GTP cyclohydrolase 1 type 2 [Heliophilum fasciatum]